MGDHALLKKKGFLLLKILIKLSKLEELSNATMPFCILERLRAVMMLALWYFVSLSHYQQAKM